jgi:hypothetical protein
MSSAGLQCVVLLLVSLVRADEISLEVSPPEVAAQTGETAEFVCTFPNNDTIEVLWLFPNETSIQQSQNSRFQDANGTLSISDIINEDEGDYICTTESRDMNATGTLNVYIMPSYFMEAMIVMGINIALVLIFIGCGIHQFIRSRKEKGNSKKGKTVYA